MRQEYSVSKKKKNGGMGEPSFDPRFLKIYLIKPKFDIEWCHSLFYDILVIYIPEWLTAQYHVLANYYQNHSCLSFGLAVL